MLMVLALEPASDNVHDPEEGRISWSIYVHGPEGDGAEAAWMFRPAEAVAKAYQVPLVSWRMEGSGKSRFMRGRGVEDGVVRGREGGGGGMRCCWEARNLPCGRGVG